MFPVLNFLLNSRMELERIRAPASFLVYLVIRVGAGVWRISLLTARIGIPYFQLKIILNIIMQRDGNRAAAFLILFGYSRLSRGYVFCQHGMIKFTYLF